MNKSDCSFLKCTVVKLLFAGFLVLGVFAMSSGLVLAAESEGEEVVEPGKVGRLEEMVEEALLKIKAVATREQRPMRIAMHFEPLLLRSRLDKPVEVTARMNALTTPVGARQHRHRDEG